MKYCCIISSYALWVCNTSLDASNPFVYFTLVPSFLYLLHLISDYLTNVLISSVFQWNFLWTLHPLLRTWFVILMVPVDAASMATVIIPYGAVIFNSYRYYKEYVPMRQEGNKAFHPAESSS